MPYFVLFCSAEELALMMTQEFIYMSDSKGCMKPVSLFHTSTLYKHNTTGSPKCVVADDDINIDEGLSISTVTVCNEGHMARLS